MQTHTHIHTREATRISHIRTASSRTSEKARGEFYIFIPRSPFSPPSQPPFHPLLQPAAVRTNAQSATPECQPPLPPRRFVLETLFHIQNILPSSLSRRVLLISSSLERPGVSLEGIQNARLVRETRRTRRTYVCARAARSGFNLKNN